MDRLPNTEQLAKEMAEFCMQVMKSAANSVPPSLRVVVIALAGSDNEPDKGKSHWFSIQEWNGLEVPA